MPILRATLSIRGLYEWDNTIFDNLVLPDDVSKDILISNLLAELAELEILYPDPDYMKGLIGAWSQKQLPIWDKWNDILAIDYNPIDNYSKTTHHTGNDADTTTTSVKGYNETAFVDSDKTFEQLYKTFDRTVTGNVGIYSFSKLISEEMELREKYNIYDLIIKDFKLRFCILVY